jgi:hypothetical protein
MREFAWSLRFAKCIECGTSEVPHKANGLCLQCHATRTELRNGAKIRLRGVAHGVLTKDFLEKEYVANRKSLGDIAKVSCCSRQYVLKRMKEFGIESRNKCSARRLAYNDDKLAYIRMGQDGQLRLVQPLLHVVDETFFETWTDEMAYVLGLIYTDGTLDPGRKLDPSRKTTLTTPRFTLAQNEKSLLEQALLLMKSTSTILYRPETHYSGTKQGALYYFHINSERVYESLIKLGLKPNKSLDIGFPDIPEQYIRHFIRGCWDGDGSIYIEKSGNIVAHFVSGSRQFINGMVRALDFLDLPHRNIYESSIGKSISPYFYLKFTGEYCRTLYHVFYDGVPSTHYLLRKKLILESFFNNKNIEKLTKHNRNGAIDDA